MKVMLYWSKAKGKHTIQLQTHAFKNRGWIKKLMQLLNKIIKFSGLSFNLKKREYKKCSKSIRKNMFRKDWPKAMGQQHSKSL